MKVIVSLSGSQVMDVEYDADGSEAITAEVRQFHRDFQSGFRNNRFRNNRVVLTDGSSYEVVYPDQEGT